MGDCMRNCKRSAEAAEMEASSTSFSLSKRRKTVGSLELQELELTSPDIELGTTRILSNSLNKPIYLATSSGSCGVLAGDMCSGLFSGNSSASRCSSNESYLEAKSFETEISTCTNVNKFRLIFTNSFINYYYRFYSLKIKREKNELFPFNSPFFFIISPSHFLFFSRETPPLSEHCGDSDEMQSPEKKPPPSTTKPPKIPSQAEIDEFFSVAEKYEQKRFAEKYNYDIVKDVPLDGRYQWLRLKP
ncbi:hypothetical protein ES332_D13G042900v1 [Gossypium tomentosum]|uniref:Cyclin-dependent kinase inhibitor domain-containing protein n=1 Tax=Gossypium tomentosum TaxID=34277 RepID=A0A5D2HSQ4_GOSTO|nr:hypothetical protein ES332_D13G042900v1 [Gossypium tomentosum]